MEPKSTFLWIDYDKQGLQACLDWLTGWTSPKQRATGYPDVLIVLFDQQRPPHISISRQLAQAGGFPFPKTADFDSWDVDEQRAWLTREFPLEMDDLEACAPA